MSNDLSSKLAVDFGQTIYSAHPELSGFAPLFQCDAARQLATNRAEEGQDALAILRGLEKRYLKFDSKETLLAPGKMNRCLYALAEQQASDESTQADLKAYSFQESTWGQSLWYYGTYWMYIFMSDPKELDCSDTTKLGREEYVACAVTRSFFAERKAAQLNEACANLDSKSPYPREYTESLGSMLHAVYDNKFVYSDLNTKTLESEWQRSIKPTFCQESTSHPLHAHYCVETDTSSPNSAANWVNNYAKNAFLPPKVLDQVAASSYATDKDEL